jgi:hypothetical protein
VSALDELLAANAAKSSREQLTLIRLFEELRTRGYDGGYDAVRRYAWRWSKARGPTTATAYVPLSFAPGEAYQFDWSHEAVVLSGVTVIVKVAHFRLCHSRMPFVRSCPREAQEMVFDAHPGYRLLQGRMPARHLRQHEARSNRSSPRRGGRARSNWCDKARSIYGPKSTKSIKLAHSGNEKRNVLRTRCLRSRGKRFSWSPSIAIA